MLLKHERVIVIADEIYEHINYVGEHASMAQFPDIKDRVVIINGVSKAYAMTGWRIGFIAAPEWIVNNDEDGYTLQLSPGNPVVARTCNGSSVCNGYFLKEDYS